MDFDVGTLGVADGYRAGVEAFIRAWEPRERLTICQWAERHRVLSGKTSSTPGRWRNDRFPYQVGIMEALEWTHPSPIVVVVKSAQSAISDCVLNWLGRGVHTDPAPFLALWPSDDTAATWSRSRVTGLIEGIPELAKVMLDKKKAGNTVLEKHFPGSILYIGSAAKANDVAQISVPNLILDDADRMPKAIKDEGDPFELALDRSATFPRRKAAVISTPKNIESSRVWPLWQKSTMNRFFVPCPHCGHMQHLRWEQLKWSPGKPKGAQYLCEECAALIDERHKTDMLAAGEWRPEHPERIDEICGFHISGLYAPLGLGFPWSNHAAAWERVQGSPDALQAFFNTRLGLAHKGERKRVEWAEVKRRAEPYPLREIPRGMLVLTSGTDVQLDRVETQVLGWGRDDRVTVIDYAVHRGDPTRPEVWKELDDYLAGEWINSHGVAMRLSCSLIDAGYLGEHVLNFTRSRKARGIYACRGSTNPSRQPIGKPAFPDLKGRRFKTDQRGAERYELGVSLLKHWLYEELRADEGTEQKPVPAVDRHLRFSTALGDDYFKQLVAETYDPKQGWIEHANYHRNEALDTFVYARAAAMHHHVRIDRMRATDWQRLEELYQPAVAPKVAAPAELGKTAIPRLGGFLPSSATTAKAGDLP